MTSADLLKKDCTSSQQTNPQAAASVHKTKQGGSSYKHFCVVLMLILFR